VAASVGPRVHAFDIPAISALVIGSGDMAGVNSAHIPQRGEGQGDVAVAARFLARLRGCG
jgi:hypothetical protein